MNILEDPIGKSMKSMDAIVICWIFMQSQNTTFVHTMRDVAQTIGRCPSSTARKYVPAFGAKCGTDSFKDKNDCNEGRRDAHEMHCCIAVR